MAEKMKIVYLVPGSGGSFYCGNCLRDRYFTTALRKTGNDIMMIPMYLPLSKEQCDADSPIFFGAVSIYLEQTIPFFKKLPAGFKHLFDSKKMLGLASRLSGSTRAVGHEKMTISMLQGANGKQADDLETLVHWLKTHEKPDVVHLSNALLSGLAERIKKELGCVVICTLQDEDEWIDEMRKPYDEITWQLIETNSLYIDRFISVSHYYSQLIKNRIPLPNDKIQVVPNAIACEQMHAKTVTPSHYVIGYMSKISSHFGADRLFDAFLELKQREEFKGLKLKYTGGYTDDHLNIVREIKRKMKLHHLENDVEFHDDLSVEGKRKFLESITLFCLPSRRKEAFAMHMLEACAAGIPAVMPDHGAYPEIVALTEAALLYENDNQGALVTTLARVLSDKELYERLKNNCLPAMKTHFCSDKQVEQMTSIYEQCLQKDKNQ